MWHHNPDSLREVWENARWVGRGVRVREHRHVLHHHAPWRSIGRGLAVARRARRPRYVLFRSVYDLGVVIGYAAGELAPRRHWK
jgi:hypothetical protein